MSTSACTLFVGDLSIYCTRNDLEGAFAQFGPIKDIRIKRDEETQKNLSYGFVEFEHISSAVNALQNMNGFVLCGRPMRMRWAANKSKKSMNTPYGAPAPAPRSESDETSAVHVTYMALHPNIIVTEESLRYIFSNYGLVLDATIKKSVANQDGSGRRGYGFVHFANTQDGVESAIKAATAMANATVHDVHYRCCMSKAFEQRLSSMMQHYRTLSPLEAYSMNCYYFNQHQQQAMMYAAALSQQVQQQQSAFFAAAPIRQQVVQEQMQQVKPVVMQQQMPAPPQQQQQGCYFPIVNVGNFSYPAAVAAPPAPVYSAPRYVTAHSLLARQNMHLEQALNASDESKSYTPEPKAAAPAATASAETNDLCAAMEKVAIAPEEEKKVEVAAVAEIALPAAKAAPEVYRKPEPAVTATSKGLDTMATVSELQAQLDQLRSTVGATRASEFATKDVLVEAEALVHCVDLCDY